MADWCGVMEAQFLTSNKLLSGAIHGVRLGLGFNFLVNFSPTLSCFSSSPINLPVSIPSINTLTNILVLGPAFRNMT